MTDWGMFTSAGNAKCQKVYEKYRRKIYTPGMAYIDALEEMEKIAKTNPKRYGEITDTEPREYMQLRLEDYAKRAERYY